MTDITNQQIFEEIIKNRNEIKNKVDACETRLLLKIEEVTSRLKEVEAENLNLKKGSRDTKEKLKQKQYIDIHESDLNNFYKLGNSPSSPIKIEFTSFLKKNSILKNCFKLKSTNITIAHDLTIKQREENKVLRKFLQKAKEDKNDNCYIKHNRLYINNKPYTPEELIKFDCREDEEVRGPNSAPDSLDLSNLQGQQGQLQSEVAKTAQKSHSKNRDNKENCH
ncbi:hypothetical protein NQ317_000722 [Molorchus minor]|uniref:Uncharacterized protein n=1 Tax=Molorchus minor TaxID=1323400 RepID=A0ABQ9IYX2_9CUCU|nr:hypothetical protein NQ317_000722 [Molorchus minor]